MASESCRAMSKGESKDTPFIGQRIQEIRLWRKLSLRACAELAGFSASHLSRIENGERPVDRRSTLEKFATVLRVAPSELLGGPGHSELADVSMSATVEKLRLALSNVEIGDMMEIDVRPWEETAAHLDAIYELRAVADYEAIGERLPDLILDLHSHLDGVHRTSALAGLAECYYIAQFTARNLGVVDLPQVASKHIKDITAELAEPEWIGLAAFSRAHAINSTARERSLAVAIHGIDDISDNLDNPHVAEVTGMLHLTAALAALTLNRPSTASDHVQEAADIAARLPALSGRGFAGLSFGSGNVNIWRTTLAVEAGAGGRAVEIARNIDTATLPESHARQSALWTEVGRGMAMERSLRDDAVHAFLKAEKLAPQRFRSDKFAKEIIGDQLRRARRNAGGRELRGLAYRMGIAP